MRRLFKWAMRLVILVVVAVVLLLVFKDTILRIVTEHQIRKETGMDVKIGRLLLRFCQWSPSKTSSSTTRRNSAARNFSSFRNCTSNSMPKRSRRKRSRIKLIRFNLAELDVVKNQAGETNLVTMLAKMPKGKLAPHGIHIGGQEIRIRKRRCPESFHRPDALDRFKRPRQ